MGKVLLFGEPMALLISDTAGPLAEAGHFSRAMSGAEVNVSIGLVRLGHEVTYLTRLGDDPFGHYIEKRLRENGIGTEWLTFDSEYRTGIQLKGRSEDGQDPDTFYYRKGSAASHITAAQVERIDLSGVDHVHVTGIPPALSESAREASFCLMARARDQGIYTSFDPNLRPCLWASEEEMRQVINELSSLADMVLPGRAECRILCRTGDMDEAADFYQNTGVKTVIIKNGSRGAYVRDGSETFQVPGYRVEKVIDTVGAGDGFAAGVISGRLEGLSMPEMVRRGNAIGALQVMNIGDNEGLPDRTRLELFQGGRKSTQKRF